MIQKLKFFEHIPLQIIGEASKYARYVKLPKNTTAMELFESFARAESSSLKSRKKDSVASLSPVPRLPVEEKFFVIISGTVNVLSFAYDKGTTSSSRNRSSSVLSKASSPSPKPSMTPILDEDTVGSDANSKKLCQLGKGDSFGELAESRILEKFDHCISRLIRRDGSRYMWVTREETELLEFDIDKYKILLQQVHEEGIETRLNLFKSLIVPVLKGYPLGQLYELAKAVQLVKLAGRKGTCDTFVLII